ncbi:MAG: uroporphyrinogen-III decarboxylase [Chloroflexi bacterium]|nr:uroporphyrinogen-III decarboxylase [Chloroflexota bacterium]
MSKETMMPAERVQAAIDLKVPDKVPVVPLIMQFALQYQGIPQAEAYKDPLKARQALIDTYDALGKYDAAIGANLLWPRSSWRISAAPTRMRFPGRGGVAEDAPIQAIEQEIMTAEDYDTIIAKGWNGFCEEFLPRVTGRPLEKIDALQKLIMKLSLDDARAWEEHGVWVLGGATVWSCTMILSICRTLTQFTLDLHRQPDKVQAAIEAMVPDLIQNVIDDIKVSGNPWVFFPLERGSAFYYPVRIFERFELPYLKKMVEAFAEQGFMSILHFDTDWTLNLPYLKELPKGKSICQFDGTTNIFKAKEVLGDHMCLMGDVPASLLTLGTPEEVAAYCEKLIDRVGKGGGFILSTGCECPVDAKFENVKAMIDTARTHLPCG